MEYQAIDIASIKDKAIASAWERAKQEKLLVGCLPWRRADADEFEIPSSKSTRRNVCQTDDVIISIPEEIKASEGYDKFVNDAFRQEIFNLFLRIEYYLFNCNRGTVIPESANSSHIKTAAFQAIIGNHNANCKNFDATVGGWSPSSEVYVARSPGTKRPVTFKMIRDTYNKARTLSDTPANRLYTSRQVFLQIASLPECQIIAGSLKLDVDGTLLTVIANPHMNAPHIYAFCPSRLYFKSRWGPSKQDIFKLILLDRRGLADEWRVYINWGLSFESEEHMWAIYDLETG